MPCDTSIYGPFSQTLFCGASISAFSTRMGWNSNESSLDVEVVEDPCTSDKVYYDCNGDPQSATTADSFMPPPLGSPIYFQFGTLSFTGIVRNWKEKLDSAKTYTINCSGPNLILDSVKVILGGYTGDVFGVPNILNVYGYLEESLGGSCPVDTSLYSLLEYYPALGFGGAARNDNGISWNKIRAALPLLMTNPAPYSGKFGGRPQFKGYSYYLDISDIPFTMDDFRIGGDSVSLLDLINTICDYSGLDWYATMYIQNGGTCNTADINAFLATDAEIYIKINVSNRRSQPASAQSIDESTDDIDTRLALGTISSFIDTVDKVSADRGIELRPEVTNAIVVGDQRQDLWTVNKLYGYGELTARTSDSDGTITLSNHNLSIGTYTVFIYWNGGYRENVDGALIDSNTFTLNNGTGSALPNTSTNIYVVIANTDNYIWWYWGKNENGYPISSQSYLDLHNFNINIADIYDGIIDTVVSGQLGHTYNVEMGELLAILGNGGKENWETYIEENNKIVGSYSGAALADLLGIVADGQISQIIGVKGNVTTVKPENIKNTSYYSARKASSIAIDPDEESIGQRLFNKLEGYAHEYLGRKFLIQPPIICSAIDTDSPYNIKLNWEESDGGWSDINPWGLPNTPMELFRLEDGRVKCMLKFDNNGSRVDMTSWDDSKYYQWDSGIVYTEATAEEIVFLDPVNRIYPRVVVSIDKPVNLDEVYLDGEPFEDIHPAFSVVPTIFGKNIGPQFVKKQMNTPGSDTCAWERYPMPMLPTSAVVPLRSNVLRYGPWYSGTPASAGPTNIEIMTDLNPWTYGSTANMNAVGQLIANTRVMDQQVIEMGSITVPGSPSYSLGESIIVNSPEITNVDVSFSNNGVTTTYQLRTFTPDYNTLSKTRIDNIRRATERGREIQRLNNLARINQKRTPTTTNALGTIINRADRYRRSSSHSFWLAGTDYEWDALPGVSNSEVTGINQIYKTDKVVSSVVSSEFSKCLPEMGASSGDIWLHRAGVETIGLFRPFATKSGDASLMASFPTGVALGFYVPEHPDMMHNHVNNAVYQYRGPVYNEAVPPITCWSLNPFMQDADNPNSSNNFILRDPYNSGNIYFTLGSGCGHDIEYVVRDGSYPLNLSVKYPENNYSTDGWYRSIGLKGPPVIVGWGYDVCGKPVPNKDEIVGSGGLSPYFADNWLQKPNLWKAGPLDIRWDYRRGVWTSPPSYRIVKVKMLESTLGWNPIINAEIVDDSAIAIDISENIIPKYIAMNNPMGYSSASGSYAWAVYNPERYPTMSGNYANYDLLYWENPVFTLRTYGGASYDGGTTYVGGSATITSATPTFGNYNDWGNNVVLGGAACSGRNYTCTYYQYNEAQDTHEFIPTTYPVVYIDGTLNSDTITYQGEVINVNNTLGVADGLNVIIVWNNSDTWYVMSAEPYNTPITKVS